MPLSNICNTVVYIVQGQCQTSVITLGTEPPYVFSGEGSTLDEANDCAAQVALNTLTGCTVQVHFVYKSLFVLI